MSSSSASSLRTATFVGMLVGSAITVVVMTFFMAPKKESKENESWDKKKKNKNNNNNNNSSRSALAEDDSSSRSLRGRGANNGDDIDDHRRSFMSDLLEQMWGYLRIAGGEKIRVKVEPYFKDLPGPLKYLRFTKIDLGSIPIRMDNILVHDIKDGQIQMDITMIWDGECDIQLAVNTAEAGSIYSNIAFGVQSIKVQGRMAIIMKPLTDVLPIISGIQYSFINPPDIDLKFTGLANIADWSMLHVDQAVRDSINASMLCMVLPNRSLYKMMNDNDYLETFQPPLGVARITIISGRGFEIEKKLLGRDDIPDVYCNISLGTSPIWRTRTIQDDCNPVWGSGGGGGGNDDDEEYGEFLVDDREQLIRVHAWDEDRGILDPDDDLGVASISLKEVLLSKGRTVELPLLFHTKSNKQEAGQPVGAFITIHVDLCEWTATLGSLKQARSTRTLLHSQQLEEEEESSTAAKKKKKSQNKTNINNNNSSSLANSEDHRIGGLLVVVISKAMDIPIPREFAATFCKVTYGPNEFETSIITEYPGYYDGLNPVYDAAFRVPLTPHRMQNTMGRGPTASLVKLELYQSNDAVSTTTTTNQTSTNKTTTNGSVPPTTLLGSTTVDFSELARAPNNTITEVRALGKDGVTGPSLQFRMSLSGVQLPPSASMRMSLSQLSLLPGTPTRPKVPTSPTRLGGPSDDGNNNNTEATKTIGTVRVTVVKAQGLQIQEELFNIDVPDVYCLISLFGGGKNGSTTTPSSTLSSVWRTDTVHNSCVPEWHDTREFPLQDHGQILNVELWDLNEREYDPDKYIGSVQLTIGKLLLAGGSMDVPVEAQGGSRGSNVLLTLQCEMVE